ncbi:MAG TPA: kelch repeat-containing protein, partial [Polyangiaceae bacterium]|nr:kelch repeat-containing protein [Polyangiaceae bacterium]
MLSAALPASAAVAAPLAKFVAKTTFVPFTGGSGSPDTVAPITPQQMQTAYGITDSSGSPLILFNGVKGDGTGQTVAIVDAFNDPTILKDSNAFNSFYSLPQFNATGGPTLTLLGEDGSTTLPTGTDAGWGVEESLDVQWIHAIAPQANIILYEANSPISNDMYATELSAAANPAVTVVSNSWGTSEYQDQTGDETQDEASFFLTPVKHQGVTFLASTGDTGTPAGFPSFSRDVVAVGGTSLTINTSGVYQSESAWSGTGGGISQFESLPPFQSGLNGINGASTTFRNGPDVAADADPNTGVLVFDSTLTGGHAQIGGTSLACPLWAGMIAIADQGRALAGLGSLNGKTQTLPMLYSLPSSDFNDVTTGSNGTYSAGVGYDLVTGLGTPKANLLIPALAGYVPAQPLAISAPSTAGVTQSGSLIFSAANGNAISVSDASAGSNPDSIALSVSHGILTLGSTTGVSFTTGTNNSSSFTITGPVANLDAALSGLTYLPTAGYLGSDSLSLSATDAATSQSASTSVSLNVVPLPSTTWTPMTNSLPNGDSGQLALLLPNGKLFVHEGNGGDNSSTWYLVTPDSTGSYVKGTWTQAASMNVGRLFFGSTVLPNGKVFVVGGEYSTDGGFSKTAEIYDIAANTWTTVTPSPQANVGDEPTELLPNGNILVGNISNNGTEIYNPTTNTWTAGGKKVHNEQSDEEPWVKLPNGDILTYDLFSSITNNK